MKKLGGLRVHRGWWVAKDAVERIERMDRAAVVHLAGGLKVPVARSRMAALREAGWL